MFIVGSFQRFWMAVVRVTAIFTALPIGVSLGIWTYVGHSLYCADILYPLVDGI